MINTERDYGNLGIVVNKFNRNLNINNLPNLIGINPKSEINEEIVITNEKRDKEKRKRGAIGITDETGRPMSAKSGQTAITGGITNAFTQFTGGKTEFSS
jgi:hypothetical protein